MTKLSERDQKRKKGFTITELVISMTVCSFILVFVAFVLMTTAHCLRKMTNDTEGGRDVSVAIEFLRYTLSMADYSTVFISHEGVISPEGHRIDFKDPNLGSIESAFEFRDGALWYDYDISDTEEDKKVARLINLTFSITSTGSNPNVIHMALISQGRTGEVEKENIQAEADIYLRND